jgi:hypothetical protein
MSPRGWDVAVGRHVERTAFDCFGYKTADTSSRLVNVHAGSLAFDV